MLQIKQLSYQELQLLLPPFGARSIDSISVSNIDSKGTLTLHCAADVLPSLIYTLIGDTQGGYPKGSADFGKIKRILPLAHPYFPWLYCTAITDITGNAYVNSVPFEATDNFGKEVAGKDLLQSTAPYWNMYREYTVKAEFSQRSYTVVNDSEITTTANDLVDFYSSKNTSDTPDFPLLPVYDEWSRFCTVEYDIEGQFLSAEQGQFKMLSKRPTVQVQPTPMKGNIRQFRPGSSITYKWYGIPYEWLTGPDIQVAGGPPKGFSILDYAQGTINQYNFDGWPEGTLLYTGAKVSKIYNRPYPQIAYNKISPKRLCDLDLKFTYRDPRRRLEDENPVSGLKQHGSFVPRGNNTVPNARDGYNYPVVYQGVGTGTPLPDSPFISQTEGGQGIYPSFPHEFLFQDPAYIYSKIGGFLV
jgi:hypothetical protein